MINYCPICLKKINETHYHGMIKIMINSFDDLIIFHKDYQFSFGFFNTQTFNFWAWKKEKNILTIKNIPEDYELIDLIIKAIRKNTIQNLLEKLKLLA